MKKSLPPHIYSYPFDTPHPAYLLLAHLLYVTNLFSFWYTFHMLHVHFP